ncbi:hypothetical protein ACFYKX_11080 [Cytobacillus sp. FJAT-54145]|uniref:Uncharacterized protein n=1 Tax=Cytobacillus spartinae TaxID=3299023 RepID=A0ABW6KC25_9BACI
MLRQAIEERTSRIVDEGTMGFHDYVERFDMSFEQFVNSVSEKYNRPDINVISISYPNEKKAVVVYEER